MQRAAINNCRLSKVVENIRDAKTLQLCIFSIALESSQILQKKLQRVACQKLHTKPRYDAVVERH